MSFVGISNN